VVTIHDPEVGRNNPAEDKHDVLSRGPRSMLDQDLKPNSDEKKKLEVRRTRVEGEGEGSRTCRGKEGVEGRWKVARKGKRET
jgi:hypothetical protein